jgi:hypothetical protein
MADGVDFWLTGGCRVGVVVPRRQYPFDDEDVELVKMSDISLQVSTGQPDEQMHMREYYVYNINSKSTYLNKST